MIENFFPEIDCDSDFFFYKTASGFTFRNLDRSSSADYKDLENWKGGWPLRRHGGAMKVQRSILLVKYQQKKMIRI
jgi:hypothetical protein